MMVVVQGLLVKVVVAIGLLVMTAVMVQGVLGTMVVMRSMFLVAGFGKPV